MRTACCLRRALAHSEVGAVALSALAPAGHREKTAVRTEAPLAAPVAVFCVSPQRRPCAAYLPPSLAPRAPAATPSSQRAPPLSLA